MSMWRGRLIHPFLVCYRRLDLSATDTAGYDDVFREPAVVDNGSELGIDARAESAELRVPAQIEPADFEKLQMFASGDTPLSTMTVIHHFRDLESMGLVDSDGMATLKKGDRLAAIRESASPYNKVLEVPVNPGLFVREVRAIGIGLGNRRNLLAVVLGGREQGIRA